MNIPLSYDAATGEFTWLKRARGARTAKPGDKAGTVHSSGYIVIKIKNKVYRAHRLAWFMTYGSWPRKQIDHINGNKQDNRISNLRDVDASTNGQNRKRPNRNSKTGLLGASQEGGRFVAAIYAEGVHKRIGSFSTAEEAHAAYIEEKRRIHPGAVSIFLNSRQVVDSTACGDVGV